MTSVLVIGGQGRVGASVARDVLKYTDSLVTVTGRQALPSGTTAKDVEALNRWNAIALDLAHDDELQQAIASHDLVIHCAGPFHYRDTRVLQHCINQGVDYLDVSDCVPFTTKALALGDAAQAAGVTAIINTGVFPGMSNSMVRLCMEAFNQHTGRQAQTIRLYYAVAGSGGAGVTVLRTTFLGLQQPFKAWINGQWRQKMPYSDRQTLTFPPPYGKVGVYWYEVPETITLAQSFPVQTVITKFGSLPDLYNHLTWIVAHWFPKSWIQNPVNIEALSQVSYRMTQVSDRFSGTGIAMTVEVTDEVTDEEVGDDTASVLANQRLADAETTTHRVTLTHPDTAIAAGAGTGSLAQLILAKRLHHPGVHPVEATLPTPLFQEVIAQRQIQLICE